MNGGDWAAARWMALCALSLSFIPLFIDLSGGSAAPFLLNALWRGAWSVGAVVIIAVFYRDLCFDRRVWAIILRRSISWPMGLMTANGLQMGLIAWSGAYANIAVVAAVFYTWPLSLAAAMALAYRGLDRFACLDAAAVCGMSAGVAGAIMVGLSEWGGIGGALGGGGVWLGCAIGLLASWLSASAAIGLRWGTSAAGGLRDEGIVSAGGFARAEIFCAMCVIIVAGIACSALCLLAAAARGETGAFDARLALFALAGGLIIHSLGDFAWRRAALGAGSLSVMSIGCCIPLGAIAALWIFGRVDVARLDLLVWGALLIAAANMAAGGVLGSETMLNWRRLMSQAIMAAVVGRYWDPDKIGEDGAIADSSVWMDIAFARCQEDCPCGCDAGDRFTPPGLCGCEDEICDECSLCDCCCHALAALSGCGQSEIRLRERAVAIEAENRFYAMIGDRGGD